MKHDILHVDKEMEQILLERLNQEKAQGIPSIPEQLRPEHIEVLLQGRRTLNKKRYILPGGMAAAAAAAAIMLIFQPGKKEANSSDMALNTAATAAAPMTAASPEVNMQIVEEGCLVLEAAGQDAVSEESKSEAVLKPEGSYEAACIQEDYLYLLQKTEVHELYVINLRNPESESEKYILTIAIDVEIMNLYVEDRNVYLESKDGKKYIFSLDN